MTVSFPNDFINVWFQWIFSASWQIALFTLLVFLLSVVIPKKYARVRYFLWLLVIARVILPPSTNAVWGVGNWGIKPVLRKTGPLAMEQKTKHSGSNPVSQKSNSVIRSEISYRASRSSENADFESTVSDSSSSAALSKSGTEPYLYLFLIWTGGVLVFFGFASFRYFKIRNILNRALPVEEGPVRIALEKGCMKLGRENPPRLYLSRDSTCPFLLGFFRPVIVLPSKIVESMNEDELHDILLHELLHWTRLDVPAGWLQIVIQGVFWFHPFIWLANSRIRHERECACDEAVILQQNASPERYGESLLKCLLSAKGKSPAGPGLPGIFERHSSIRSRLEEIMKPRNKSSFISLVVWTIVFIFGLVFLPMSPRGVVGEENPVQKQKDESVLSVRKISGEVNDPIQIQESVHLLGSDPSSSIIQVEADAPAIRIKYAEKVILENLTIRWAPLHTDVKIEEPAAVYIRDSSVIIRNCKFEPVNRPRQTPYAVLAAGNTDLVFENSEGHGFAYTVMYTDGAKGTVRDSFLWGAGHSVVTLHEMSEVTMENNILGGCEYHAVRNSGGYMKMSENIVIDNNRAGAYLGNKDAHGFIRNNLFYGNRGGIWAYYGTDVTVENNIFTRSSEIGVSFWDTCNMKINRNSIIHNPVGMSEHQKQGTGDGARTAENHFWKNAEDTKDFEKSESAISGDPMFNDPVNGDYSVKEGSPLLQGNNVIGLTDPGVIHELWKKWEKMKPEKSDADMSEDADSNASQPPRIVSTFPEIGARGVDPAITAITVTFDKDMSTRGYSWTGGGPQFPPIREGKKPYWKDKRTCVLPVNLEPGHYYRVGINAKSYKNFQSEKGIPVKPEVIYFTTAGATESERKNLEKPKIVEMNPQNGARDVDPDLKELRVTFNVPMGSGFSWTGGPPLFPDMPDGAKPYWTNDKKTCVLPVELEPARTYRIGLNSPSHNNFQSDAGVPLDPVIYTFTTAKDDENKNKEQESKKMIKNFKGANLLNKNFIGADFTEVNLMNADLTGATLTGASMNHANLTDANFKNAKLKGTSLEGVGFKMNEDGSVKRYSHEEALEYIKSSFPSASP